MTQRSKSELKEASRHLLYEYKMLITTAAMLEVAKEEEKLSTPRTNALIESFAIHFRALLDFFEQKKPSKDRDGNPRDDVLVRHFLRDGKSWKKPNGPAGTSMRALRKRVGKEVAHLTYTRLKLDPEDNERRWPKAELVDYVKECVRQFRSLVDPALLHEDWQAFVEHSYERAAMDEAKPLTKRLITFEGPTGTSPSTSGSFTAALSVTPASASDRDPSPNGTSRNSDV